MIHCPDRQGSGEALGGTSDGGKCQIKTTSFQVLREQNNLGYLGQDGWMDRWIDR